MLGTALNRASNIVRTDATKQLKSQGLETGRQALGNFASGTFGWAAAGGVVGSLAPVNPLNPGDSFSGVKSGAMAGGVIGGLLGGRRLMSNMAKGKVVGSESADAIMLGKSNHKHREITSLSELAGDRRVATLRSHKMNKIASMGDGNYDQVLANRRATMDRNRAAINREKAFSNPSGPHTEWSPGYSAWSPTTSSPWSPPPSSAWSPNKFSPVSSPISPMAFPFNSPRSAPVAPEVTKIINPVSKGGTGFKDASRSVERALIDAKRRTKLGRSDFTDRKIASNASPSPAVSSNTISGREITPKLQTNRVVSPNATGGRSAGSNQFSSRGAFPSVGGEQRYSPRGGRTDPSGRVMNIRNGGSTKTQAYKPSDIKGYNKRMNINGAFPRVDASGVNSKFF